MISTANRCRRTGLSSPNRSAVPCRHPAPTGTSVASTRKSGRTGRSACRAYLIRGAARDRHANARVRHAVYCPANRMTPGEPVHVERA